MSSRYFTLTKQRIIRYSDECFGVIPTDNDIQKIASTYDEMIDRYGEVTEGEVIDIIADIMEVY